jgi:transcriptional regulator with XRE-family HTH domain
MALNPLASTEHAILVRLLRQARKDAGVTQVELATRLGVEQSLISKVERCERRLDIAELLSFCNALGVSLTQFVATFEAAIPSRERT